MILYLRESGAIDLNYAGKRREGAMGAPEWQRQQWFYEVMTMGFLRWHVLLFAQQKMLIAYSSVRHLLFPVSKLTSCLA